MLKCLKLFLAAAVLVLPVTVFAGDKLGLGRAALPEEIAAWDVDIRPNGAGLPAGSGDVIYGEEVFVNKCASCHGDFAEGVDNWPVLAGGFDTLGDKDPVKTVGSYWPYLSTVWDYVNRSMPFGEAQSLSADEVYAIVAYMLYSNDLVDDDFVLSDTNFAEFEMHNAHGFVIDDRPETEYAIWRAEPCMQDCKDRVEITMRASILDVTPEETAAESTEKSEAAEVAAAAPAEEKEAAVSPAVVNEAEASPELVAAGKKVFRKCKACHQIGPKAKSRSGPHLNNILGRGIGAVEGFRYSKAFKKAAEAGQIWDMEQLVSFLANPKKSIKGTKMSFSGLKKQNDIDAIIAYLNAEGA
ncbi:MAG: c-type cytochrome [Paracoccaceae bacterium]